MLKRILSFFSSSQRKSESESSRQHGVVPPVGTYAWAPIDLDEPSVDGGEYSRYDSGVKRELYVCATIRPDLRKEAGVILSAYASPSFFLSAMLIRGHLALTPSAQEVFRRLGENECRARFLCWPIDVPVPGMPLGELRNQDLFLYSYFASLTQKKHFSVQRMPKTVTRVLSAPELEDSLKRLLSTGLMAAETNGFTFSTSDLGMRAKEYVSAQEAVARFIVEAESATVVLAWEIATARDLGRKLGATTKRCVKS